MTTKEEDFVETVAAVHSHSFLLMFTTQGKIHVRKAYQIPEASRTAKGTNIVNIIDMLPDEKITSLISIEGWGEGEYLTMVTKKGIVKRTLLKEYEYQRKGGKIAINLDEGDELVYVMHTMGDCDVILATRDGMAVRYTESNVRCVGRTARGVRGITLRGDDYVTGVTIVDEEKSLVTITEGGFGKRTPFSDFREMKNRGGKGVTCHKLSEKTGALCGIAAVSDEDDLMMITDGGTIVRTPACDIPTYSRTAGGVIVMRLAEGQRIVNFTKVAREKDEEEEIDALETVEEISTEAGATSENTEE
jgi:DNA gyrase subunit A